MVIVMIVTLLTMSKYNDIRDYVDDAREMDEVLNLLFQANPPFLVSMLLNFALDGGLAHTR